MIPTSPCRGCGRPVVLATTTAGRTVSLDQERQVFRATVTDAAIWCDRLRDAFVQHVCRRSSRFKCRALRRGRPVP